MNRRGVAASVATVLVFLLGGLLAFVRVPYIELGPGPVCNTVGPPTQNCPSRFSNTLIQVTPARLVHPRHDQLFLTTVSVTEDLTLFDALRGWLSGPNAVVPRQVLIQPGQTSQQVDTQQLQEMTMSQDTATIAALTYLGDIQTLVTQVKPGFPAAGVLHVGDVLTTYDGGPIGNAEQLVADLGQVRPGTQVRLGVLRRGVARQLSVGTTTAPGDPTQAFLGIGVTDHIRDGISVQFGVTGIGGPSAGLMLTLGILDELSAHSLTGGIPVAGTGTIDALGNVGAIGGIQQKMYAARNVEHVGVFLAPAGDCAEARQAIPAGLRVIAVHTLSDALAALAALREGRTNLPSC
ncbi:MAG: YlbL family protein [Mycobacteriales bacterium]